MVAAKAGHSSVVGRLLEAGAPWNALDKNGLCAGEHAEAAGHQDVVNQLVVAGCRAELILAAAEQHVRPNGQVSNQDFLARSVRYSSSNDRILDEDGEAVMMEWEQPLMEAHAEAICCSGGDILNVGFGLGLIDAAIQRRKPRSHTIIEAHPDVHKKMLDTGWDKKEGVKIVFARWQEVLPGLGPFDGIFFDTYGEYYDADMREFHSLLPKILKPGGVYSFFNGLVPTNPFFQAVYRQIVDMEMAAMGIETTFISLPVDAPDESVWKGVKHRYWCSDAYYLPVCEYIEADHGGESQAESRTPPSS
ncbi:unnamed protein product [Ostreobium quekettii]|uniref:RMT2 domain-containing protein n=1 Tax=Ostreobium quekettii TaxID=121088 RepID=A0A8S1J193_9CHLO|nr:unnamed protein product [Ostreobium quekettii]